MPTALLIVMTMPASAPARTTLPCSATRRSRRTGASPGCPLWSRNTPIDSSCWNRLTQSGSPERSAWRTVSTTIRPPRVVSRALHTVPETDAPHPHHDFETTEPSRGRVWLRQVSGHPRCVVPTGTAGLTGRIGNSQVGKPMAGGAAHPHGHGWRETDGVVSRAQRSASAAPAL